MKADPDRSTCLVVYGGVKIMKIDVHLIGRYLHFSLPRGRVCCFPVTEPAEFLQEQRTVDALTRIQKRGIGIYFGGNIPTAAGKPFVNMVRKKHHIYGECCCRGDGENRGCHHKKPFQSPLRAVLFSGGICHVPEDSSSGYPTRSGTSDMESALSIPLRCLYGLHSGGCNTLVVFISYC